MGGIGTYQTSGARIVGNIILYGMGSTAAIPWGFPAVNGVYIDDDSEDIEVRDNVIGHMGQSAALLLFYQPNVSQRLSLAEWQADYGYDLSSRTCDTD